MFAFVYSMIFIQGLFIFKNRYVGGFTDKRMIQVATGYTHCLGLADVSLFSSSTGNN
jgi:hypothetical protein